MTLSEAGLMPSEFREPSGPLTLLSIVEFLKVLSSCPDLLYFQRNSWLPFP